MEGNKVKVKTIILYSVILTLFSCLFVTEAIAHNEKNTNNFLIGHLQHSTLIVQPVLKSLYIVSAGSRFWIGGMAGNSSIDMDLILIDEATGQKDGLTANPKRC